MHPSRLAPPRPAPRPPWPQLEARPSGLYSFKPAVQRALRPTAERLAARGIGPDALSAAAVALALAGAALLMAGPRPLLALLAPIACLRLACNALDGMLARAAGHPGPRGYLVNELSDRLADALLLVALAWSSGLEPRLGMLAPLAALLGSHLAVAGQAAGAARQAGGLMGKAERMAVLAVAGVAAAVADSRLPLDLALLAILVGAAVTLAARAWRLHRGLDTRA